MNNNVDNHELFIIFSDLIKTKFKIIIYKYIYIYIYIYIVQINQLKIIKMNDIMKFKAYWDQVWIISANPSFKFERKRHPRNSK